MLKIVMKMALDLHGRMEDGPRDVSRSIAWLETWVCRPESGIYSSGRHRF